VEGSQFLSRSITSPNISEAQAEYGDGDFANFFLAGHNWRTSDLVGRGLARMRSSIFSKQVQKSWIFPSVIYTSWSVGDPSQLRSPSELIPFHNLKNVNNVGGFHLSCFSKLFKDYVFQNCIPSPFSLKATSNKTLTISWTSYHRWEDGSMPRDTVQYLVLHLLMARRKAFNIHDLPSSLSNLQSLSILGGWVIKAWEIF